MNTKDKFKYFGIIVCAAVFIYGAVLFKEASEPCSSDGCMIHLLYMVAVPMMLISGIAGYKLTRSINKERNK